MISLWCANHLALIDGQDIGLWTDYVQDSMRLRINYMLFQTLRAKSGDGDCNGSNWGKFEYFCEASFDFGNVTKCPTYKDTPFNNRIRILYRVQYIMEIFTVIDINISFLGPFISLFFNWKDFLFLDRITRPRWSWVQSFGNFSISWSIDFLIKPPFLFVFVGFFICCRFCMLSAKPWATNSPC